MAAATRRNVPARVAPKPKVKGKEPEMFEIVSEIDPDGNVDVKVFGEPFTISTDVNAWLLMLAGAGGSREIVDLVRSVLVVVPNDGEEIDAAQTRVRTAFDKTLSSRSGFSVERCMELINDLVEAVGNET